LAVLYVVTAAGCALAWDWQSFVVFRFIGGLAIGGSSVIGPMYIAEITPAAKRGRLVALFQFNVVSGILLAYLSNWNAANRERGTGHRLSRLSGQFVTRPSVRGSHG
jgi:MFS family permease